MRTISIALLASTALVLPAAGKDASYIGSVQAVGAAGGDLASGTVFIDENRNSEFDSGEAGVEGVMVSNGREVVLTAADGSYEIPAYDDMNLFITQPAGHQSPLSSQMVPQFYYIHKVAGSPDLRFGGIEPTGPLPEQINFPLIADGSDESFDCLVFGDAQPYSNTEIGYVRETAGNLLAGRDNSNTECLIFEGDVMGDDLSLYDRFKDIIAVGGVPQYFVGGNHDLDFDAESDQHSFDTFRAEWGPEYYSFDIGNVHFVVLDNVRYPCSANEADAAKHAFCNPAESPTYNGVISDRQLTWLAADLANVPEDKLIVLNAHIPFQTFTDNTAGKHQTDNFSDLAAIIGDRPALGLSGHTHTTEQLLPGVSYDGWEENTGLAASPFHQIVTGGLSGSWWTGDLNDQGVPHGTQRLGSPRGYYKIEFSGSDYVDTYLTFHEDEDSQLHASFNTPRFRDWAEKLLAYADLYGSPSDITPPVTRSDLGDMYMLTTADLAEGTWVAVNVWNGSPESTVSVSINGGDALSGGLTQPGTGEVKTRGPEFADPLALAKQATQSSMAAKSTESGEEGQGFYSWKGTQWAGVPGPFQSWMLTDASAHLWRVDLPADLPVGAHVMEVTTTDRYGRTFSEKYTFEIVEEIPPMQWDNTLWEEES
ncbi:MAG: calcineurin-like phosphoesterase family protein [Pseudomonadota bacterium]